MNGHIRIAGWLLAGVLVVVGCQAQPGESGSPAQPKASTKSGKSAGENGKPVAALQAPPGVEPRQILPRQGDFMVRGRKSLEQALKMVPKPAYLDAPAAAPAPTPPLAAQRAYAAGRLAMRQNQFDEAQRQLHAALNLAPNQPEILRLLGQIYNRWNNKIRGAFYLEQAVRADPGDYESIFALGRHALEQGRWDDAVATLAHSLKLILADPEADPALQWLVRYYLSSGLEQDGFDAAAAEQLRTYLESPGRMNRSSRMLHHLFLLDRQRNQLWVSLGDAMNRLDDPAQALEAYSQVKSDEEQVIGPDLIGRRLYTLLRLGKRGEATRTLMEYLRLAGAEPASLQLVSYATASGLSGQELSDQLDAIYQQNDRPAALAVVIADLLPPAKRAAWIQEHLRHKPSDSAVLERLVVQSLALRDGKLADPAAAAALVDLAATVVERSPQHASDYAILLTNQPPVVAPLLSLIEAMPEAQRQRPGVRFLRATLLIRQNRGEPATAELRALLEQNPDLQPARIQLAALLAAQEQFEQAALVLEPLKDSTLPQVLALRVRILAETGQSDQALQLINELIARQPNNVELIVDKALLQIKMNDAVAAERTLWDALNLRPDDERLYAILFQLYDSSRNPLPDATQQYVRLMRKMLGTIPHSRLARLKRAETATARGDFEVAQELLRGLMTQNPRDMEALDGLLDVLVSAGKRDEAEQLLQQRLTQTPDDRGLLTVAYKHYHDRVEDARRADEVGERLLRQQPASPRRDEELVRVYLRLDRPQDAAKLAAEALAGEVEDPRDLIRLQAMALTKMGQPQQAEGVFRAALTRYPQHEADLLFFWASQVDQAGDKPRAEKMFLDLLQKHPEHPDANNHLGYTWADQGRNLEQAQRMIEKALESEPNNAAYLDSMGWVHYKQGNFAEAVRRLKQSVMAPFGEHPVIMDHLGDALYRNGEQREAVQVWRRAQHMMTLPQFRDADEPDLRGLADRLAAKIQAAMARQAPVLADAPGGKVEPARADAAAEEAPPVEEAPAPMQPAPQPGPPPAP